MIVVLAVLSAADPLPLRLWYDLPATECPLLRGAAADKRETWAEYSLPIGNGFIAGTVFGEVSRERVVFNDKTLWRGGPAKSRPNYMGGNLPDHGKNGETMRNIQQLFQEGKDKEGADGCDMLTGETLGTFGTFTQFGDLWFDFGITRDLVTEYVRDLNLDTGVASVDFTYRGARYHREYFVSYPHNVLVAKFTVDGPKTLRVDCRFDSADEGGHSEAEHGYVVTSGALKDNEMVFNGRMKVVSDGKVSEAGPAVVVTDASEVLIVVSSATDYKHVYPHYRSGEDADQVNARVREVVDTAAALGFDALKAKHIKDHSKLFGRVSLDLGATLPKIPTYALLEKYTNGTGVESENRYLEGLVFQHGRYLTMGASREQSILPANLQGIWCDQPEGAAWEGDYHMNVNMQMNYWLSYSTNLIETIWPVFDYIENITIPGRVTAKVYAGVESTPENPKNGFLFMSKCNPFGWTCAGCSFLWGWSPGGMEWMVHDLFEHYLYTGDVDILRDRVYPLLKELMVYWPQVMVEDKETGRLISSPGASPEQYPRVKYVAFEQEMLWQLYNDSIQAAEVLGVDADLVPIWRENMTRFKAIEIGEDGQIKEWCNEKKLGELGEKYHRHMSQLIGFYPLSQMSPEDVDILAAVKVSLIDRSDGLPNPEGQTGWGVAHRLCAWARTGDGEHAFKVLQLMLTKHLFPNMWNAHFDRAPPFQIEASGGMTAGIAEMVLQSVLGKLHLLPAIPKEWANGKMTGMLGRGGFQVDIDWADGKLTGARILSNMGRTCVVEGRDVHRSDIRTASGAEVKAKILRDHEIEFETEKGTTYVISNVPGKRQR